MAKNDHHKACAQLLMKERGVPARFKGEITQAIETIYDGQRMAHTLIVLSIRGFRRVSETRSLEYLLQEYGTKTSRQAEAEMLQTAEEEY